MDGEDPQFSVDTGGLLSPPIVAPIPVVTIPLVVRLLAGIETGVLGGSLMAAWMFAHSWWIGERLLAPANIWATSLYGGSVMRYGPSRPLAGFAVQLAMACLVAVAYALAAGGWKRFYLAFLSGLAAGASWYFLLVYWNRWIAVYSPQPETFISYLLFGIVLSRTPLRCIHLAGVLASAD